MNPAPHRTPISGVILAGGRGQRMGGVDKGLIELAGRPMVAHVIERLAPQVDDLMISANRNMAVYAGFGYPVFGDDVGDFAGPLAGLHAALARARHPLVLTAPCDSPALPADLATRLLQALNAANAELAVATTAGRSHPVFCLCRRDLLEALAGYLAGGGRRVDGWQRSRHRVEVAFDDQPEAFANLNTPADLPARPA